MNEGSSTRTADDAGARLLAYTDRLSASAGDEITLRVSCPRDTYLVDAVLPAARGGGLTGYDRGSDLLEATRLPGKPQGLRTGSYMRAELTLDEPLLERRSGFALGAWALPTLPARGQDQGVIAQSNGPGAGLVLGLSTQGRVTLWLDALRLELDPPLLAWRWAFLAAGYREREAWVGAVGPGIGASSTGGRLGVTPTGRLAHQPLLVAAMHVAADGVSGAFDGKISDPWILAEDPGAGCLGELAHHDPSDALAHWDFGSEPSSALVRNRSSGRRDGVLVNMPTRAVTGPCWKGREVSFAAVPHEYNAIHFHSDDLADAGWEPSVAVTVPEELHSDVYAFRLRDGAAEEWAPFVVTPNPRRAAAEVLVLLPTFTYLSYCNDTETWPELGLSLYDRHEDGTGVCVSGQRRPIPTLDPRYLSPTTRAPRQFSLDLHILSWLRHAEVPYEVATDHELDRHGADLLDPYRVVILGSHPEYVSESELDGLASYIDRGGRVICLGGNGLYWVTSLTGPSGDAIEVRRGHSGTRTWDALPGELRHASTGEPGGLWRHRGRAPQRILGVGFIGQGWSGSVGYSRTEAGRSAHWSWVFEGVDEEPFGEFGLVMGGASGDELDAVDYRLGTPVQTSILASAIDHGPGYDLVIDDVYETGGDTGAEVNDNVRSDMVICVHGGGGAVFSVGSLAWVGALSMNGFENSVARISENVVRRFIDPAPIDDDAARSERLTGTAGAGPSESALLPEAASNTDRCSEARGEVERFARPSSGEVP